MAADLQNKISAILGARAFAHNGLALTELRTTSIFYLELLIFLDRADIDQDTPATVACFVPRSRGVANSYPIVGVSQSVSSLRNDAREWLRMSQTIKLFILLKGYKSETKRLAFEFWDRRPGTGRARHSTSVAPMVWYASTNDSADLVTPASYFFDVIPAYFPAGAQNITVPRIIMSNWFTGAWKITGAFSDRVMHSFNPDPLNLACTRDQEDEWRR
ncbi:hypothetical protein C8J56DRAFT_902752 [Mycena floridula]|nr:hypothetical protein C8J56DRAFT_902752 [Mycena floridula]